MKANELMIGDLVYFTTNKIYARITEIYLTLDENPKRMVVIVSGGCRYCAPIEQIKPVPLTQEILEKNGFKPYIPENHLETVYACQDVSKAVADELYALWPYQDGSFYLLLRVNGKDMVRMDVHYIHQLQHALRLCKIEKTIEL